MGRKIKLLKQDELIIIDLYNDGENVESIANSFDIDRRTVYNILTRYKVTKRKDKSRNLKDKIKEKRGRYYDEFEI